MKAVLRDAAIQLAWRTGLSTLARLLLTRGGRFVLELHGVSGRRIAELPREAQPSLCRDELAALLSWLAARFRFLTADDFLAGRAPGVLLTFDDGFANNVTHALPLLEEHGAPAVFFVATQHVADPRNWLPATRKAAGEYPGDLPEEIARDLFDGMSAGELAAAAASPLVTIGSHTVSHPRLSRCGDDELAAELRESKRFLENAAAQPVELFAYPTGDYDRRVAAAVRAAGYRAAFVEESRGLGLGRWEIPRIGVYGADPAYLGAKLCGLYRRPLRVPLGGSRGVDRSRTMTAQPERIRVARIRVVHLINHLGRGGSERQLVLFLRHLDPARFVHRVVVFNPSSNKVWDDTLARLGVEVVPLPESCRGVWRRLVFLARRLRPFRPHVLQSWTVHDNPYAGLLGRWLGVPVRWGCLRGSLDSPALRAMPALVRHLILHSVDRVVVNSRALVGELAAAGYREARVTVLPNCVETGEAIAPADFSGFGLGGDEPLVGTVGNLRRIKNHEMFVRAMAEALPRHPRARALIVGQPLASEPDYPSELESEIRRGGLEGRVILTGFHSDVPAVMKRLSVVCLTSHSEGSPNSVLEAMVAGRPVVAVRVGGVPELVRDGENGFVVEPGDAGGLASAVSRLLADPGLAAEMGEAGRRRAIDEYGCSQAAARLASAYEEALAGRRR